MQNNGHHNRFLRYLIIFYYYEELPRDLNLTSYDRLHVVLMITILYI